MNLVVQDNDLYESYARYINYRYPLFLNKMGLKYPAVKAEGAVITDSEGRTYLDCIAGYGIFNLGHNHPALVEAIFTQLRQYPLTTKPFISEVQIRFAELLNDITPGELSCSFSLNSGSEAIDCAIKLARLSSGRSEIITARNSFHGLTFGALSASGIEQFQKPFGPLVPGFISVPYGNIESIKQAISEKTAAVLLEPIQHEAGVNIPPQGYLRFVRDLCNEHDIVFILDEIKTGMGKTGRLFACEHEGITPDILVLGKSLGGGLIPIGTLVAKPELWRRFSLSFPMSASSYAGNTLACCVGIEVIRILQESNYIENCEKKGAYLLNQLEQCRTEYNRLIKSVNGLGYLIGLECASVRVAQKIVQEMIRGGVLVMTAFGNTSVIMIEPPLILSEKQVRKIISVFFKACEVVQSEII